MSKQDDSGLFAMLDRLFRAFMLVYWLAIAVFVPLIALFRIGEAIRRWRVSRDKYERAYWSDQFLLYGWTFYLAATVYIQVTQDILLFPFSVDQRAIIMDRINAVLGSPGAVWYAITNRTIVTQGDPEKFLVASIFIAMILWCYYFAKKQLTVNGAVGDDDLWAPSRRRSQQLREQFDAEEAEYRKWSKIRYGHDLKHPMGDPDWKKWPKAKQDLLMQEWQAKADELDRIVDACPRASCYTK